MLFVIFSITNAHPFKNEKELQDFYAQIDKEVDMELKKDYLKLFAQRRINLRKKENNKLADVYFKAIRKGIHVRMYLEYKQEYTQTINKFLESEIVWIN